MYTHEEFLAGIKSGELEFRVNPDANRAQTELRLSNQYRRSVTITKGVSTVMLLLAIPLFFLTGWLLAALSVAAGIGIYIYFVGLNYRVFVRAQVKDSEEFFDQCQKSSAIIIMKIPEKIKIGDGK